jgi:hypothetical protein
LLTLPAGLFSVVTMEFAASETLKIAFAMMVFAFFAAP